MAKLQVSGWKRGLAVLCVAGVVLGISGCSTVISPEARKGLAAARLAHGIVTPLDTVSTVPQLKFLGNTTTIVPPASFKGDVLLARQADCSLTEYLLSGYSMVSGSVTMTTVPNYQNVLHAAAALTTTANQFKNGCADTMVGKPSGIAVYAGTTKSGLSLGAMVDSNNRLFTGMLNMTTGAASFTQVTSVSVPLSVVAVDLDKDGNQDLVIADYGSGSSGMGAGVKVMKGVGDGTFAAPVTVGTGRPAVLVVDDMNHDGKLDVIAALPSSIVVFPGNGDGTFGAAITGATGSYVKFLTGDFDGDGTKDIVTSSGVTLKGKGDGTFTAGGAIATTSPGVGGSPAAGDFNNDGKLDIAFDLPGGAGVYVYLGKGDGTFTQGATYATFHGSDYVSATDIDGDGNIDLVIGQGGAGVYGPDVNSFGVSEVLLGNGDGTFQGATVFPRTLSQAQSNHFAIGDFNGDGSPDILETMNASGLLVRANNGKGKFTAGTPTVGPRPVQIVAAQMNGDKKLDAVFLDYSSATGAYSLGVAFGNGDGTFQATKDYAIPAAGTADPSQLTTGANGVAITTGDFNGDGLPDVAMTSQTSLLMYLNDGLGGLKTPTVVDSLVSGSGIAAGDLNGDGKLDLVVMDGGTATARAYVGKGDGTFGTAAAYQPDTASGVGAGGVALADLTGDGKLDIVFGTTEFSFNNPILNVLPGKGDGTFGNVIQTAQTENLTGIAVADFDGDGKLDVLQGSCCGNTLATVSLGKGDGTFPGTYALANALSIEDVAGVDLNGDGHPDIVVAAVEGGADAGITVFLSLYGTAPATPVATTTGLVGSPNPVTVGKTVTFTATVAQASGSVVPTGTVTFLDGTTTLGTGPLNASGVAAFATSALSAGTHAVTASYGGDVGNAASVSAAVSEVVVAASVPAVTSVLLSASTATATVGDSLTFTGRVVVNLAPGVPTGTVTFLEGATAIGAAVLNAGTGVFSTTGLAVGTHVITASYGGDAGDAPSVSNPVTVVITAVALPTTFTLALNPTSGTVAEVSSITTTVSVTPTGGFNQPVTFACSGLPVRSKCNFQSGSLTPNGVAVSTTLSIATGVVTISAVKPWSPSGHRGIPIALGGLLGLGLMGWRRRVRRGVGLLAAILLTVAMLGGMTGCGGNGASTPTMTPSNTPAGTSAVTITATSGATTQTAVFSLTVQ